MPSLARLRDLDAFYDGPIPMHEIREMDERFGRAIALATHHRNHAAHARRCYRRGQQSAIEDFRFHAQQFRRWNKYLWDLRRNG